MQETFFFQAMVFLAAAVVVVPIAKKLGLGAVLGYLQAGAFIGPACLHFNSSQVRLEDKTKLAKLYRLAYFNSSQVRLEEWI